MYEQEKTTMEKIGEGFVETVKVVAAVGSCVLTVVQIMALLGGGDEE